jgi:hypothetical protein
MIYRAAAISLSMFVSLAVAGTAAAGDAMGSQPVLVELYTSQGCSDCPPADEILADLSRRSDVIALSFPITYWDMLGWKDTLATASNTDRQKAYAEALGRASTYTPQMIVNGVEDVVGNKRHRILSAVTRHYALRRGAEPISFNASYDAQNLTIDVSGMVPQNVTEGSPATIWVMRVLANASVAVEEGENKNQMLVYTNIVRDIRQAGTWSGGDTSLTLPITLDSSRYDGIAIVMQSGEYGQVLAAALLKPAL